MTHCDDLLLLVSDLAFLSLCSKSSSSSCMASNVSYPCPSRSHSCPHYIPLTHCSYWYCALKSCFLVYGSPRYRFCFLTLFSITLGLRLLPLRTAPEHNLSSPARKCTQVGFPRAAAAGHLYSFSPLEAKNKKKESNWLVQWKRNIWGQ